MNQGPWRDGVDTSPQDALNIGTELKERTAQ